MCVSHLLFLRFLPVVQEEQGSGQEKHAPQDDDEGTQHESVAQTEEPPQRRAGIALLEGVRDLQRRSGEHVVDITEKQEREEAFFTHTNVRRDFTATISAHSACQRQ